MPVVLRLSASLRSMPSDPHEVRSLLRARKLGVPTPVVYHVDHATSCIYMERVQGHSVKTLLRSVGGGLTLAGALRHV